MVSAVDIKTLSTLYLSSLSNKECAELAKREPVSSFLHRIKQMTLWEESEITWLCNNIEVPTKELVERYFEMFDSTRTRNAVTKKIEKLRGRQRDLESWERKEEKYLRTHLNQSCSRIFKGYCERFGKVRSKYAITSKLFRLRQKKGVVATKRVSCITGPRWTPEEIHFVQQRLHRKVSDIVSDYFVEFKMRRTINAVELKIWKMRCKERAQ